jgi:DNA-binding NarL/FixJ family response regulator
MDASTITVIIADDHPVIHHGIEGILFADRRIAVIGTATSFTALLEELARNPARVVILDLNDMGATPLGMVRTLRERFPQTQLLVFSSSIAMAPELIGAGVRGYVVKEELLAHLPLAIQTVAAGQPYLSPLVQEYQERTSYLLRKVPLLPQEFRVLKFVAEGMKTRVIADNLNIDPRTAQNYITSLYQKTGCETREQLAIWYRRRFGGEGEVA